jgi:hypothetical protein
MIRESETREISIWTLSNVINGEFPSLQNWDILRMAVRENTERVSWGPLVKGLKNDGKDLCLVQ